jgi:hypothetical protein
MAETLSEPVGLSVASHEVNHEGAADSAIHSLAGLALNDVRAGLRLVGDTVVDHAFDGFYDVHRLIYRMTHGVRKTER